MNTPLLKCRNLGTGYPGRGGKGRDSFVLRGLDLDLHAGELICLLGPNGAGKSTLLRTLAGLQPSLAGDVLLAGVKLDAIKPRELARMVAVVLTDRPESADLSVHGLVALGRHPHTDWLGRLSLRDEEAVRLALEVTRSTTLARRLFTELSDGEKQRVLIARAMAQEPSLMILDEPTAFLDLPRRVEIMRLLRTIARKAGKCILLSTHDLEMALRVSDRILLLPAGGPLKSGAPEDLVLDGSFARTFDGNGVSFDKGSGHFRIFDRPSGHAYIDGDGLGALWTRRALEREGYAHAASREEADLRLRVRENGAGFIWREEKPDGTGEFLSIADLVQSLRKRIDVGIQDVPAA